MNEDLYTKKLECPVCLKEFKVTKVRAKACRVDSRDTDFCVYYEGVNPLLYAAWVCENCGYAALSDSFLNITDKESEELLKTIGQKWNRRSFEGERSLDKAIEAFMLVLASYQMRGAKASEMAKICLRIAWLYRAKEDIKELDYIRSAADYYQRAYENEHFPADKLDENTCMYMVGELNRRAGNYEEAATWLGRIIGKASARKNTLLMEKVRSQYQLVKEKLEN